MTFRNLLRNLAFTAIWASLLALAAFLLLGCAVVRPPCDLPPRAMFPVESCSMLPTMRPGDTYMVERCGLAGLRLGDIALYEVEDFGHAHLICHRVIALSAHSALFRGDNNPAPDGWVSERKIRYRVTFIEPGITSGRAKP